MNKSNISLIAVAVVAFIVWNSTFIVNETEKALKLRLGEVERVDYEPGLHFRLPLVNNIIKLDSRVQTLDAAPENYLTGEKMNVQVDSFVKWRIVNVEDYYLTTGGDMMLANLRLSQIIKDALRGEFAKRTLHEVISKDRNLIMEITTKSANEQVQNFGMEVIDVRIKRVDLPDNLSRSVYDRMDAERERIAKEHRSRGQEASERIRAEADKQRTVLIAQAEQTAQELRGEGDAKAIEIYAKAYGKDTEFYQFYRSLEAYKKSFNSEGNLLMLNPDSEFFKYFGKQK